MILALAATLAIVAQDQTALRAAPRASATVLTVLSQGDVVEIRGEHAGYLKVYNYRRERGGYFKTEVVRLLDVSADAAPELLAVVRFLRYTPGSEALGISYGAAYLRAVPARALTAEPFDAIAVMAERLADEASGTTHRVVDVAAHIDVVEQFGVRMRSFERYGRIQVCYDGELFRRVLTFAGASPGQRARAALGLTRGECIDPDLSPVSRAALDDERSQLLDQIDDRELDLMTRSRLHVRRAGVWASITYELARRGESAVMSAQRALAELLSVRVNELGDENRAEYMDAIVRVSAIRWAVMPHTTQTGPLIVTASPGEPGQTCVALNDVHRQQSAPLVRRCTYGLVWLASAQPIAQGRALVLAVQPLESWRELWLFHEVSGSWTINVLSPGSDEPEEGYIEFAGFAPRSRALLVAREVKEHGRFRRRFEELRLGDLALMRHANAPELLPDFGRWQDVGWRRDTLALH